MKSTKRHLWFMLVLALVLALSACERPAPREEVPTPQTNEAPSPAIVIPTTEAVQPGMPPGGYPAPTDGSGTAPEQPVTEQPPAVEPSPEAPAAVETPAEPAPVAAPQGERIHVVQSGENLFRIGLRYGFTYQQLGVYNGIAYPYTIYVGQEIKIPPTQ